MLYSYPLALNRMANVSPPRRSRRVLLLGAGLIGISVCGVLALASLLLIPSARPVSMALAVTLTPVVVGAMPTSAPQATLALPPSSAPPATRTVELPADVQPATGELHFNYPLTLLVEQDEIVQLEIVPDRPVALASANALGPSARLLIETSPNDTEHRSVAYSIPLYPVMAAELDTARKDDLTISAGSETKQAIDPFDRNFWTWSLVARRGGEYRITLRLFGYNTLADQDPVRQVVNDTRILQVRDRPLLERLTQGLADNWLVLFGTGGPIALILAALSFWLARRSQKSSA